MFGMLSIVGSLIQALFSKKGTDAMAGIIEGFRTRKEDLEVNWGEYYKYNK